MKISKAEYCQFSLRGRQQLTEELGELVGEAMVDCLLIKIYRMYDFYVEVRYEYPCLKLIFAEPVKNIATVIYTLKCN